MRIFLRTNSTEVFMKKLYDRFLPKYSRLPLLTVLLFNCFTFWVVPIFQGDWVTRYDLSISIDYNTPFVPAFIVVYVLAFVQWAGSYIYHCGESRELCYRMTTSDLIAKVITMLIFIILPTQLVRPDIVGNGPFEWLTSLIYAADKPISLFPSVHCLESWMCFRTATMLAKKNKAYITIQFIFTLLVFASVVFVKQHFFVDIIGGVVVAELGLLLYRVKKTHIFEKVQLPSAR